MTELRSMIAIGEVAELVEVPSLSRSSVAQTNIFREKAEITKAE
jgi:hypothetical protein